MSFQVSLDFLEFFRFHDCLLWDTKNLCLRVYELSSSFEFDQILKMKLNFKVTAVKNMIIVFPLIFLIRSNSLHMPPADYITDFLRIQSFSLNLGKREDHIFKNEFFQTSDSDSLHQTSSTFILLSSAEINIPQ